MPPIRAARPDVFGHLGVKSDMQVTSPD